MSIKSRLKSWLGIGGAEGSWRGPFFGQGEWGGWFQHERLGDGWQRHITRPDASFERFGPVYACVSILSQEISRIGLRHWAVDPEDESRKEVVTKAPARVFRKPNAYQTRSDFMLNLMRALLFDGNAYAVAKRNDRLEVESLHPLMPRSCWPYIAEDGEIFYQVGEDAQRAANLDTSEWFPQRDVLHIRLFCPRHPLVGESPLVAALAPVAAGTAINNRVAAFFHNASRPSGILRHPGRLDETAMRRIKDRFMQLTQNGHTGEPVVLQEGMEWTPMDMTAVDAELIKSYNLTERQVAQIFRVPPFLLGDLEKASFQNVESLTRFFLGSGLGFYIDHLEEAFTRFFNLPVNEHILFDVEEAFLRADLKERAEAYGKMVQNGIAAPNELRRRENLPPVEFGDEPRVQQQLVPLSFGMNLQAPPAPGAPPGGSPEPKPESPEEEEAKILLFTRDLKKAVVG